VFFIHIYKCLLLFHKNALTNVHYIFLTFITFMELVSPLVLTRLTSTLLQRRSRRYFCLDTGGGL